MDSATRDKIVAILGGGCEMTLATIRPDGFPQATTVSYVHDGLTIYFGTAADKMTVTRLTFTIAGFFSFGFVPWLLLRVTC